MQEIEYGIVVFASAIGWREVYRHAAHAIAGGRIVYLLHYAMLYVLIFHRRSAVLWENEIVEVDIDITHNTRIEGVKDMIAINDEIVLIEVVRQFVGGKGECSIGCFGHIELLSLQDQADMLGIGIGVGESYYAIG